MKSINEIASRLNSQTPAILPVDDVHRAAVAALLCENAGALELLFIERATIKEDPWSGHIAFPGGRKEDADADVRETAERETLEELGLDLGTGRYLGQLDDLSANIAAIIVVHKYLYNFLIPIFLLLVFYINPLSFDQY